MDCNKLKHNFIPKNNVPHTLEGRQKFIPINLNNENGWEIFHSEVTITPEMEQNMRLEDLENLIKSELINKLVELIFESVNCVNIERDLCPYTGNTKIKSKIKIKRT